MTPDTVQNAKRATSISLLFTVAALVLVLISVFFRLWHLGNIPGLNGDEALIGNNAIQYCRHGIITWTTPNGNIVDVFYLFPSILLSYLFPPSVVLLRSVSVISGILAIIIAGFFGRQVLGTRAGTAFCVLIAVLPEDIVQSRLGWEPSQSVFATIAALYCCVMILIKPQRSLKWILFSALAIVCAANCHPTNILIGVFLLIAVILRYQSFIVSVLNLKSGGAKSLLILGVLAALVIAIIHWRNHSNASGIAVEYTLNSTLAFFIFFARLFNGITCYRYVPGSWMPGSVSDSAIHLIDVLTLVVIFVPVILNLVLIFHKKTKPSMTDQLLLSGWAILIFAFYLVAGAGALLPGNERYGLVLIAPTLVVVCRALTVISNRWGFAAPAVSIAAVSTVTFFLVSFYYGYFRYFEQTGGTSQVAYLTGSEDPKLAAWNIIDSQDSQKGQVGLVITSTWWNKSPLMYFSSSDKSTKLVVIEANQAETADAQSEIAALCVSGKVWYVEFYGSNALAAIQANLKSQNIAYTQSVVYGYANRPIDVVLHVTGAAGGI